MTDRAGLLDRICETTADYRAGDIAAPTPAHVDRWIRQFPDDVQVAMLAELAHVLDQTYFSRISVVEFLEGLVASQKVVGPDPTAFWKGSSVMDVQVNGHSQEEIRETLETVLLSRCGLALSDCVGTNGTYVYVDDALFSGNRITNDLTTWLNTDAPAVADVHVIVIAGHTYGEYISRKRLKEAAVLAEKQVDFHFWATRWFENRKMYRDRSELLWPAEVPDDPAVSEYLMLPHKFPFERRSPGGPPGIFSSESGRQLLERELLVSGARIRSVYMHPTPSIRPLGFSPFGLGFGSLLVTHRNCPNNTPLALWWGLDEWHPLFPRKTYS